MQDVLQAAHLEHRQSSANELFIVPSPQPAVENKSPPQTATQSNL